MPKTIKTELEAINSHIRVIMSRPMSNIDKAVLRHMIDRRAALCERYS